MPAALLTTPTGVVMSVIATTPVVMLPLARILKMEKITTRPPIGGLVALAGVIGLAFSR